MCPSKEFVLSYYGYNDYSDIARSECRADYEAKLAETAASSDPLWRRLEAAGYDVDYIVDGGEAFFDKASKVIRKATRVAHRDHRDGKIKAGQQYVETTTRIINHEGFVRHEINKRVIR